MTSRTTWATIWQHSVAGSATFVALRGFGAPSIAALAGVLAMGIAHEVGDGDFRAAQGGPWNGVEDVVWFVVAPVLWALFLS